MAVQVRRGPYSDFNANKLVPGEWAAVTSGDPNASDGCATYMCFAPGNVKRMATYEDMAENINAATSEIQGNFSAEMNAAMGAANAAAASAQSAAAEAETAKESANTAAANANTAAEAANAAANGDVSGKTVTFQEATERANVQSGDSLEVAFGKLAKFCADLKDYAFEDTVKNLTTGEQGKALDATMGKALDEKIGNLNDLTTTSKDSVVDAVDELNMKLLPKGNFAEAWTTCSRILGSSTATEIPMRNGDSVLTISSASIFTESGWHDVNVSGIYPRINCWLVSLNTENITDIEIGKTYLLKLSGNIS